MIVYRGNGQQALAQRVVVVDDGTVDDARARAAIQQLYRHFPRASHMLLVYRGREQQIPQWYETVSCPREIILVKGPWSAGYRLWRLRRAVDTAVLFSLVWPQVAAGVTHARCFLYNRWYQWWRLRCRVAGERGDSLYAPPRARRGIGSLLRSIGLALVSLRNVDEGALAYRVMVAGVPAQEILALQPYARIGVSLPVDYVLARAKEKFLIIRALVQGARVVAVDNEQQWRCVEFATVQDGVGMLVRGMVRAGALVYMAAYTATAVIRAWILR